MTFHFQQIFPFFFVVPRIPLFLRALGSRDQPVTPHSVSGEKLSWLPSFSILLILLFSSLLSLFILPLVQSNYWPFCQGAAQNAVSNTSNQLFPLSFLPPPTSAPPLRIQTMAGVDRQCTAVILTPPHLH